MLFALVCSGAIQTGERERDEFGPKSLWCVYVVLVAEVCVRVCGSQVWLAEEEEERERERAHPERRKKRSPPVAFGAFPFISQEKVYT
jgi:hypothetical protein